MELSDNSNFNIFTQKKHNYELVLEIVVAKPNLFIKPQMKHQMFTIGGEIQQGKYDSRPHTIWL